MTTIAPPLLVIEAVSQIYGHSAALSDVTLKVVDGEFLSIIGPSGCGKSTLLKIISGILTPTRGEVRFRGNPIGSLLPTEHEILMVWQSLALFPHLDVAGNIGFGLAVRNVHGAIRERRISEVLELVQLSGFERRRVDTLSGGEQQRVALARALVLKPTILLLDEPVQGLDRHLRSQLIGTIRQLHHQLKVTMVMVTHEQSEALLLSTRLAVMRLGRIEQIDKPDVILRCPATKFVAEFVGDRNVFPGRVLEIKQDLITVETPAGNFEATVPSWISRHPVKGQDVAYVIDAHKLILGEGSGNNRLNAVIEAIVETGVSESIELASPGVSVIKCLRLKTSAPAPHVIGGKATLSWNSADAYILPNE